MIFNIQREQVDRTPKHPFVASYSPLLRTLTSVNFIYQQRLQTIATDTVTEIAENEEVAKSLKVTTPGLLNIRQIDIRNDEKQIMFKTFLMWAEELDCWMLMIEFFHEEYWEDRNKRINNG